MKIKRKIKINMSVEMDVLMDDNRPKTELQEYITTVAKNYVSCLGDKDLEIDGVILYDNC